MKIVLLETLRLGEDISLEPLKEFGDVIAFGETNTYDEARQRIGDADVVIVDQFPMNEESLSDAKNLKLVTMTSTGTDFVDTDYTNKRKLLVSNIRGYSTYSVAQHTITMLLYLYEKLEVFNSYVKSGKYINDTANSSFETRFHDLSNKTWGIVGLGKIGEQVARIATSLGCRVVYNSPSNNPHSSEYEHMSLTELLKCSDIVSVHCPLSEKTKNMFDKKAFSLMKENAYFINCARGGIVVEEDLVTAILNKEIAGAGLDVLVDEPMSTDTPIHKIMGLDNVIITPHMGWASVESRTKAIEEIALNIKGFVNGKPRNVIC